jgi:hypothetical protein
MIILLIIILLISIKYVNNKTYKYSVRTDCIYLISETLTTVLNEIKNYKKNIYIPCTYDDIEMEYDKFPKDNNGIYFLIDGINIMIAKEYLYKIILDKYGLDKTLKLMPQSWIMSTDKDKFLNEFNKDKIYIIKKNIQRQNGLTITNDLNQIIKEFDNKTEKNYPNIIIQELLQDPYLIDGRKINLRVYVLVIREGDISKLYIYNDGFIYYTAEKFKYNSTDPKINITTGYIDREVYRINPLTHTDFRQYLTKKHNQETSDLVFTNIQNLIKDVFGVFLPMTGNIDKLNKNLKFQIFGADVAIDDNFGAKIMEINKGPDLGAKDEKDSLLKHNMVRNMFNLVEIGNFDVENKFIQLI